VIPGKDACFTCLSLYRREGNTIFKDIDEDPDLPMLTNECNNPVRAASAADLKVLASLTSRTLIDYFQDEETDKNHWIWSMESLENFSLAEEQKGILESAFIPQHPSCPTCKTIDAVRILVSKEAHEVMKQEAETSGKVETGGILIGYVSEEGNYIVQRATLPGSQAVRSEHGFERDVEFSQRELERALNDLGDRGLYLGEWHYHPRGSNAPSGLDIKSLTEIAKQDNYRIDKPIMIILSPSFECAITIHTERGQCVQLPFEVVEEVAEAA